MFNLRCENMPRKYVTSYENVIQKKLRHPHKHFNNLMSRTRGCLPEECCPPSWGREKGPRWGWLLRDPWGRLSISTLVIWRVQTIAHSRIDLSLNDSTHVSFTLICYKSDIPKIYTSWSSQLCCSSFLFSGWVTQPFDCRTFWHPLPSTLTSASNVHPACFLLNVSHF